jgi:LPXTG-motif cell wall-anchored protein
MYGDLPHTGIGALILTLTALTMTAGGWVMTKLGKR